MNPSPLLPLCKECGDPNAWSLMDKKYRSMCGQCYNALEALMITHKNQHNSVLEVDSLVFLAQSLMGAHTP
jgi:NMD protein affecting ribosome stability and mRNA decay